MRANCHNLCNNSYNLGYSPTLTLSYGLQTSANPYFRHRMSEPVTDIKKQLGWKKIVLPVILGMAAAIFLLVNNLNEKRFFKVNDGDGNFTWVDANLNELPDLDDPKEFVKAEGGNYILQTSTQILADHQWKPNAWFWLLMALLMVVVRDFGYIYRLRVLSGNQLTWRQAFDVILLWEFSSALTPSVVGGSGVAIFILNREGMNLGRSTSTIFTTALLDEIFYIITVPLVFFVIGSEHLFSGSWSGSAWGEGSVKALFYIGYGFIVFLTVGIILSIFNFPHTFKRLLMKIFSLKLLRRWLRKVIVLGDEVIISSTQLKGRPFSYWAKAFGATIFSWTARFWTLNFIILIFVDDINHLIVYGRQLVMWVIMLISPTPGSSGVAELALSAFFEKDTIPVAYIAIVAIIWRLLTYFLYLFLGVLVLPKWFARTADVKPIV